MSSPATAGPVLVRVVDDDTELRMSIVFLAESVGLEAEDYASAADLLADLRPERPGCLVLDVRMPGMSGLALQQELARRGMELPVIFVTGHGDISMAVSAMKGGAFDFIEKPFKEQALLDAIERANRVSLARRGRALRVDELRRLHESLTEREREVAVLVARGQSNKVIARGLGISDRTVQVHRGHVMEKMRAHSAAELARILIDLDPGLAGDALSPPSSS